MRVTDSRHAPLQSFGLQTGMPGGLNTTVVDLSFRTVDDLRLAWSALHDVPDRMAGTDRVVFVWPEIVTDGASSPVGVNEFLVEARERSATLGSPQAIAVLVHVVGEPPRVVGDDDSGPPLLPLLVRAIETRALVAEGGAVIRPATHHFRLPSGSHSREFVRIANAFRSPRDIWCMSAWLASRLRPNSGIVLDTTTLAPIAAQLEAFAAASGFDLGPTVVLDRYPRSRLEVSRAVESAADRGSVLACLSVNSTGRTQSDFESALQKYAPDSWTLDVIVESRVGARVVPVPHNRSAHVWLENECSSPSDDPGTCRWCQDPAVAHAVRIDERSFLPIAEPLPSTYMPSTDQTVNAGFWELCSSADAVRVESLPAGDNLARAERVPLGVRIDFDRLTATPESLPDAVSDRVAALSRSDHRSTNQRSHDEYVTDVIGRCVPSTVVLCDAGDEPRRDAVVRVLERLGISTSRLHFNAEALAGDDARTDSDIVLCFALGSVTGAQLKSLRIAVIDAYPGLDPVINGLCIHARPPTFAEWEAIRNSFRPGRLAALWLSWLPWSSPLREEHELLVRSGLGGPAISNRRAWLANTTSEEAGHRYPESAIWAANEHHGGQQRVRERSIYGREISATVVFAAIGSAIHTQRLKHGKSGSAQRFMVDIPRVARSYFDAVIVAAIIRWTKPGEAWWGEHPTEQGEVMTSLLRFGGSTTSEMAVLVPELLVATALGKVPKAAQDELLNEVASLQRVDEDGEELRVFTEEQLQMISELLELVSWSRSDASAPQLHGSSVPTAQ